MTTTFNKIIIAAALFSVVFGIFGYITNSSLLLSTASAQTSCGSCGEGGEGGGGEGGGGSIVTRPTCDISTNITSVVAGGAYTISWNVVSTAAVNVYINGAHVNKSGSATYNFKATNNTETFNLTAQNAGGSCSDSVVVTKKAPPVVKPTCDIKTNISSVVAGGAYTISWIGAPAAGTIFKVNGTVVDAVDSATYNFKPVNNTETYTMTGTNSGGTCTDQVTVTKKVTPPIKSCDVTASATSVASGSSVTLTWATVGFSTITINGVAVTGANGSKTYTNILSDTTYTLVAKTADGTGSCTATVIVKCVPPSAPTCVLTANPTTVTVGGTSKLTWTSNNAVTGAINQGIGAVDPKNTAGFRNVNPTATTTYTLTVANAAGVTAKCAATVKVTPVHVPVPTCVLTATPTSINQGASSKLTWTTTNAESAVINQGIGSVALNGAAAFKSVNPSATTTYIMTVTNSAGVTKNCTAKVAVIPKVDAPKCDSFTASPVTINRGGESTLTWNTTNASSVVINNGIGSKSADGSVVVKPLETTTYNLTVNGTNGGKVNCPVVVVTVRTPETPVFTCENNVNFSASDTSIDEGENTKLTWTTTGATSVSIDNGVNSNELDGEETVSPNSDITYTLTAIKGDKTVHCPISIDVNERGGGGGGSSSPRCTLKISDDDITKGERVTLKWDTSNATEITLKDNHGKTLVTTDDRSSSEKRDLYDGEITLRPDSDTTYTLTAERGSKDKTCKVEVDVKDGITVIENRDQQPLVTGIALTQVPYTGFEAGAFLTTLFYALLAMFAAYLAYIFVIRRDGVAVASAAILTDKVHTAQVFAQPSSFTPNFHQVAPVVASTATIGYAAAVATEVSAIEAHAHAEMILLSADALAQLAAVTDATNVTAVTADVFAKAKASYPSEDGYVTIGLERLNTLLA